MYIYMQTEDCIEEINMLWKYFMAENNDSKMYWIKTYIWKPIRSINFILKSSYMNLIVEAFLLCFLSSFLSSIFWLRISVVLNKAHLKLN